MTEVRVLATGEDEVVAYLEAHGVPDFGIGAYLDCGGPGPGRWPWGVQVDDGDDVFAPDAVVVTVTYSEGVYRVESGPAAEYFAHADGNDEGDEG
jgi:hypothetical protein